MDIQGKISRLLCATTESLKALFLVCSVPEQTHRMLMALQGEQEVPLSSFGEHGQTVRDTNKSYNINMIKNIFYNFVNFYFFCG